MELIKCDRGRGAASQSPPASGFAALTPQSALRNPHFVLRLLDASANRAREGLRVIEDYVRFVLDDGHLTAQLKHLRHRPCRAARAIPDGRPAGQPRDARPTSAHSSARPREQTRADLSDVVTANFKRLEESLRSLEEHSKTIDAALAAQLEQLALPGLHAGACRRDHGRQPRASRCAPAFTC